MKPISSSKSTAGSHDEILQLLPWYVKRTLSAQDAGRVEVHLEGCPQCQSELIRCQDLAKQIPANTQVWQPSASHFNTIMARVDAYEAELQPKTANRNRHKPSLWSKIARWFAQTPAPMHWILGFETAACLGLLLFITSPLFHQLSNDGSFQTLSSAEPVVKADGVQIRLLFADDMTTKEINHLMKQAQAQIRQGPSAVGSYAVEVTRQNRDNALNIFRSHPKVKLAQPIAPAQ